MDIKTVSQKDSQLYLWIGIPAIGLVLGGVYAAWYWIQPPARKPPVIRQALSSPSPAPSWPLAPEPPAIEGFSVDSRVKPTPKPEPKGLPLSKKKSRPQPSLHSSTETLSPCEPVETVGFGPQARIAVSDWNSLMKEYHGVKADLEKWIISRKFSPELKKSLSEITLRLKIQRAPTFEEPDLAWRGVGVLTRNTDGEWLIRTGGGFLQSLQEQRTLGRFQLMRMIIQAWPIETLAPWNELLDCLHITDPWEARWAISTIIAAQVNSTGCQIPALQETEVKACIAKVSWLGGHHP